MRFLFFILYFNLNLTYADKISVIVSIPPQQFILESLADEWLDVSVLIESGQNPENWSPKPQQLVKLSKARLFFMLNLPFEMIWQKKIKHLNPQIELLPFQLKIINKDFDRHTWLNPQNYAALLQHSATLLTQYLPEKKLIIQQRVAVFQQRIQQLIKQTNALFTNIEKKEFWVYHPAWGYFANFYGLKQIAIEQQGKTPSTHDLIQLIRKARQQKISVIFVQPQFHSHESHILAQTLKAQQMTIDPLAKNYFDNMLEVAKKIAKALH